MPQCSFHPEVETNVSCGECGRYICPKDMVATPVGYKCRDCARPAAGQLGYVKPKQYVAAAVAGLAAAILGGLAIGVFGLGSLLVVALYGALVGEATRRGSGGHRTPPVAAIAAMSAALGALVAGSGLLGMLLAAAVAGVTLAANRW